MAAAAPDKAEMAVPVDAVPNVVATAKAADGPNTAKPIPAVAPARPTPLPIFSDLAASVLMRCTALSNRSISMRNARTDLSNSLGVFVNPFTYSSTGSITSATTRCRCSNSLTLARISLVPSTRSWYSCGEEGTDGCVLPGFTDAGILPPPDTPAREQKKDPGYAGICRDMPGYSGI